MMPLYSRVGCAVATADADADASDQGEGAISVGVGNAVRHKTAISLRRTSALILSLAAATANSAAVSKTCPMDAAATTTRTTKMTMTTTSAFVPTPICPTAFAPPSLSSLPSPCRTGDVRLPRRSSTSTTLRFLSPSDWIDVIGRRHDPLETVLSRPTSVYSLDARGVLERKCRLGSSMTSVADVDPAFSSSSSSSSSSAPPPSLAPLPPSSSQRRNSASRAAAQAGEVLPSSRTNRRGNVPSKRSGGGGNGGSGGHGNNQNRNKKEKAASMSTAIGGDERTKKGGGKNDNHVVSGSDGASRGGGGADREEASQQRRRKRKYQRKRRKPESERRQELIRRERQAKYEQVRRAEEAPSIWSFEALFPAPVWDDDTIKRDLYEVGERDGKIFLNRLKTLQSPEDDGDGLGGSAPKPFGPKLDLAVSERMRRLQSEGLLAGAPSALKVWRDGNLSPDVSRDDGSVPVKPDSVTLRQKAERVRPPKPDSVSLRAEKKGAKDAAAAATTTTTKNTKRSFSWGTDARLEALAAGNATSVPEKDRAVVDPALTRMVEDRLYGLRRTQFGEYQYDTSLMGDGAVKFRNGVRLGNALKVNADIINFHAKRDMSHGRLEEAEELYERAIEIDPRDGRAYLGLSRIAQRRRDFAYAKECLRAGIANSFNFPSEVKAKGGSGGGPPLIDSGANPFLLQALGCLEERVGNLSEAEALYVAAAKSRPSHAAAWVALAQLRTRKLRLGASAGRACYRSAEKELRLAGLPPSAHVYTAWASMEHKKAGDVRRARELFEMALEVDPRCSAAWLQLGVMEAEQERWGRAQECFEAALKHDPNNSRVLQAFAIMESRRPDGDSREVIGLFERALRANPRDGGVLQAYALYVARLGDIDAARDLLRRGTEVDKRHAAVWQAWGVLETRHGTAQAARDIFQQGIWSCAQSGGGQSGGRRCARLWQAWGVLESREGDHAAARRCFSRALDADKRSVAAVTAWTLMEEGLGNYNDARSIFELALKQLPPSSEEKMAVWRAYELMEQKAGNAKAAQNVYQRSMRESITVRDDIARESEAVSTNQTQTSLNDESVLKTSKEVEVVRWRTGGALGGGEVWLKNGSIEGKVPVSAMKKSNTKKAQ